ncbi:MAG: glycosyltransferase family 9 protein, partial [Pirellulaceae bacterium]
MLPPWQSARRLLCVRLDSLGDVFMTSPAIRALKVSIPDVQITLLTSPAGAEAARLLPDVDRVWVYQAPWMKHTPVRGCQPDHALIQQMMDAGFDGAVVFTVFSQNPLPAVLVCYLAGIPLRLGYCRENPYQLLTHWLAEVDNLPVIRHEVRRQLDLVAAIGAQPDQEALRMRIPAGTLSEVRGRLQEAGIALCRPWLVVHPGATASSRRYPPELFAEAAQELMEIHGFQIVLTGAAAELGVVAAVRQRLTMPVVSLAGRLSLAQFGALLSLAPLLISNNSGPVHMAAAAGTPVVDLYALTNPQHTPWAVPHRVLNHD